MIAFVIYFLVLCTLIYKTGFFGLLRDSVLNPRFYLFAFLIKCAGIGLFYVVYYYFYGSTDYADTYNFMHDSKVLRDIAKTSFSDYVKVLFGFQDESEDTALYKNHLFNTVIWNKNPNEFLYNDNRIVVRLHSVFQFVSFNNYFVHSLFGAFMSFIGINWIYRAFKFLFNGKEVLFFSCWLLFPGTLFWTSGVLKEAPALFLVGLLIISLKKVLIENQYSLKALLALAVSVFFSLFFKHYLMLPVLFLTSLFFIIVKWRPRISSFVYAFSVIAFLLAGNVALKALFGKSLLTVLAQRQHAFRDMSAGGLFLVDSVKFVRLPHDYNLVKKDAWPSPKVTIRKGVPYTYWEHSHQQDTLYCAANTDTSTAYKIEYSIVPARATYNGPVLQDNYASLLESLPYTIYITLLSPFFYNARGTLDLMASAENLLIALCLLVVLIFSFRDKSRLPWLLYFLSIAFAILIIIGLTSPNPGAIVRYRALVIPFIMMSMLLVLNINEAGTVLKFFRHRISG